MRKFLAMCLGMLLLGIITPPSQLPKVVIMR